ncbi:MAG: hypothetical protein L6277_15915 [Desulfobacterales bacterium]|nr:hypothetical protein [Desulfobacterales bacterium]
MMAMVMITLSILGLLLTQTAYGMEQAQRDELNIIKQYQYNLKRIPENLTPEQKYIIEQHLKNQMNYERGKIRAAAAKKMAPPKEGAKAP